MNAHRLAGRPYRLTLIAAALLGTQLVACGGGGDDTPPPATTVKLRLTGRVTDEPVANADVSVHVGARTFTATADADGDYSVDVEVPEDEADGFVSVDARGTGAQSFVEFTSLLGDLGTLAGQAGDDGTLTPDENFATQVTNVSTAEAALLRQANGGQPITSAAVLQSLGSAINGQDVLDLATAIKLAVDAAASYPLPEGYASTLDLVNDAEAAQAFVAAAHDQDPAAFAETQTAISSDSSLNQPLSSGAVPATLTAATLSTDANFTFNYFNRVSAYTFNADGSGTLAAGSFSTDISWAVEGSTIRISYAAPIEVTGYDVENCNGTVRQVQARHVSDGATLSLLSARTLASTETEQVTYLDCPSLEARTATTTSARTILADSDFAEIDGADLAGSRITFYVYDAAQHAVKADIAVFNADGSGSADVLGKGFDWSVDAGGRAVTLAFDDGSTGHYRVLRAVDAHADDLFYELDTDDGRFVDAGAALVDLDDAEDVDAADVPGRYYQFGIGNEQAPDLPLKGFRLRFDVGGSGAQEDDFYDGEVHTTQTPFFWRVQGDGIAAERTYDIGSDTPNCQPGTAGCIVTDRRWIIPLAGEGLRKYVLELRFTDTVHGVSDSTPNTALVRFYDYEPLDAAALKTARAPLRRAPPAPAVMNRRR
ncbi:hypothetical protein [Solimonas soli]|uniref:hypothetical protein n=1 Tax=Solimonas soli TaxID=413479 RepID=UPI0004819F74|nr:hypothetical protein [Solimonas soli]